jgi:dephospho-CoA kinase
VARDGATREQVLARIALQLPVDQKRQLASYVVDTSGTKEDTIHHVEEVYRDLLATRETDYR